MRCERQMLRDSRSTTRDISDIRSHNSTNLAIESQEKLGGCLSILNLGGDAENQHESCMDMAEIGKLLEPKLVGGFNPSETNISQLG